MASVMVTSGPTKMNKGYFVKQTKPDFTKLSDEIVLRFLAYLKDPRDLCVASQVCPVWQRCAQDDKLWECMQSIFGIEGELEFWKTYIKLPNY